jgi:tRNA G18 (ribose-2'-O)-methylase SpoU
MRPTGSHSAISSRQHPLVKTCRELHGARGRREHEMFLVEGRNAVEAALDAKWPLTEALVLRLPSSSNGWKAHKCRIESPRAK